MVHEPVLAPSATRLRLSETFDSIQGEGASAGKPCFFVRLAHCNLRCAWCDTRYSWDFETYDYHREVRQVAIETVRKRIVDSGRDRLVLTGGEPLLQQEALATLLDGLPESLSIEVETNGTIEPAPALCRRVDQWNVSPKLSGSGEPATRRLRLDALRVLAETRRAWLKLVVATDEDATEARQLVDDLRWPPERVLLMPEAARAEDLVRRMPRVESLSLRLGYGVSPRLHVLQFDGERGR